MKFFIIGIPGTKKTSMGDYFSKKFGYVHCDFDNWGVVGISQFPSIITKIIICLLSSMSKIIITWGLQPNKDIESVIFAKKQAFKIIYFDGNIECAKKAFLEREAKLHPRKEQKQASIAFDQKIKKITESKLFDRISPIFYNVFTDTGEFKSCEVIANEIFNFNSDEPLEHEE